MEGALLVLNAGSSSLKFAAFADEEPPRLLLRGKLEELSGRPRFVARAPGTKVPLADETFEAPLGHDGAVEHLFRWAQKGVLVEHRVVAAAHRVVHGGTRFVRPVRIDDGTLAELERLVPLAPLHQPHNLSAVRAVARRAPTLPQVACFDTAFHASEAQVATAFALPVRYAEEGVRRYGFHGISYEYVARALPDIDDVAARGRTVILHLGNGASMCAIDAGRSVATTMGFSTLDGLVMGTRSGAIDPGVLLYLLDHHHMSPRDLERLLYEESGLLGIAGDSDMRQLLARTDAPARAAVELFVYRIRRELGSLVAALGGLDAIVFTGGIGENAAPVRAAVCRDARWLGVALDEDANIRGGPRITRGDARPSAWVVPTDEEKMMAIHAREVLGQP